LSTAMKNKIPESSPRGLWHLLVRSACASGSAHSLQGAERRKLIVKYLLCIILTFYIVGYSADLKTRITKHLKGQVSITKNRLPLVLVYYEAFVNEKVAREQELFYKTGQGRRVLKNRLKFL